MPHNSGGRIQFKLSMDCPKCGQSGIATWEEAALPNPSGLRPMLLNIPAGFYHRVRKDLSSLPEVVCEKCGTVQPD